MARLRGQTVNIALAAIAIALVIAVVVTQGRVTTGEREARENMVLSAFREDQITELSIDHGKTQLSLERSTSDGGESNWMLTAPVREDAEPYAMDKLLGSLEFASWVRKIEPEKVDRAGFGLDAPKWVLKLQMGEIRYALRLGKESPSPQGSHYLEVLAQGAPGSAVGVVSRDLVAELEVDAGELRGSQIMPYLSSTLARVVIDGKGGTRKLVSKAERWYFDGMLDGARVNREAFDAVLVQFARTKAEHFIDVGEAKQALADATDRVRVTMIPKDAKTPKGVVEVGGKCKKSENDVVALRIEPDPVAACVPLSVMPGLGTPADALVDRSLFSLRKDEVESLAISAGKQKLDLARKETGFVLRAPVQADVELDVGNQHLESITGAEGTIVTAPDLAKLGLSPASGRATLRSVAESEASVIEEVIELGKPAADGKLHVRRLADGIVLEVDRDTARLLVPDATLLRKKRLLDFAPSELLSLEIDTEKSKQHVRREPSGVYSLEQPKGFEADASLATTAVDVLGSLEAERWVASSDDGSFGFERPTLTVRITLEQRDGGARNEVLILGSPTAGGNFAKLESSPGVFVLARRTIDTLRTPLLDRSLFMVAPDAAKRLMFEHDGKKIVLERRGASFVEAGTNSELTPERIARATEALASLRAEAAIHVGPPKPAEGFAKPVLSVHVEPVAGDQQPWTFRIGTGDSWQGISIHYARREGANASFVIAQSKVRSLIDALY